MEEQNKPAEFNEANYLKEKFGLETVDAVKEQLTVAGQFAAVKTELDTIKPEYEKIKPEFERISNEWNSLPEAAKYVADLSKKGVTDLKTIIQYHDVDPDKMDDDSAIKLAARIRNKGWGEKHVEADFTNRFVVDPNDTTIDDTTRTLKEGAKIQAAQQDRTYLKDFIGKQFQPAVDTQQAARELAFKQNTDAWSAKVPSLVSELKQFTDKVEIQVNGKNGQETLKSDFKFDIPDNDLKGITDYAIRSAVGTGAQLNDEGIAKVKGFIAEIIQARYAPQIRQAQSIATNNAWIDFIGKEFNNPGIGLGSGPKPPQGGNGEVSAREQAWKDKARKEAGNGTSTGG